MLVKQCVGQLNKINNDMSSYYILLFYVKHDISSLFIFGYYILAIERGLQETSWKPPISFAVRIVIAHHLFIIHLIMKDSMTRSWYYYFYLVYQIERRKWKLWWFFF